MVQPRRASLADLDTLVAHRRRMYRDMGGHSEAELDAADPVYRRWLRQRMNSGKARCWIVDARDAAAASGCVWVKSVQPRPGWPSGAIPYLLSMYTEPEHRGKGHATRIVKAALKWSRDEGYPRLDLHASEFGRPIYAKLGFERTWEMRKRF